MKNDKSDIVERSVAYSLRIINLYHELEKDSVGRILWKQLLRSGTSIGANVHEAQGAQSKADFISKMSIAHKEARESAYWLRLLQESELIPPDRLRDLSDETDQLIKILSSILITAKRNKQNSQGS
ncbi:MAG: four helix bundle protein [Desulfobacterales bacterium]|nr:four helix bundle protein [Desulfobacterales bacterium]